MITTLIQTFARVILGVQVFERLKAIVARLDAKDELTGAEKRSRAIDEVKSLGLDIAGFLVNLGIELAVAYFRKLKV